MRRVMFILFILFSLVVGACAVALRDVAAKDSAPAAKKAIQSALNTPELVSLPVVINTETPTLVPTATTGWQSTVEAMNATNVASVQTLSAVRDLQVAATENERNRQHAELVMTEDANHATWTAAPTVFALTATQQAVDNALHQEDNMLASGALTATYEAPTRTVVEARAINEAKWEPVKVGVSTFIPFCNGIVVLLLAALVLFVINKWRNKSLMELAPSEDYDINMMEGVPAQPSAPVRLWELNDNVVNRDTEPPGDPEKFRALIRHAERGNYLGINSVTIAGVRAGLYGSNEEYKPVLKWLEDHQYIQNQASGAKVFSSAGEVFCANWEQTHPCPFDEDVQNHGDFSHDNDNHAEGEMGEWQKIPREGDK